MKKILGNNWLLLLFALAAAGTGYMFLNLRKTSPVQNTPVVNQEILPTPTLELSPAPPSPTPPPAVKPGKTIPASGGVTRGQIICSYQIPATPNSQGTARLDANWNSLVAGKNGSAEAAICVSVNGGNSSLMSLIPQANGSSTISVPWISLNANYNFQLFDQHGGELGSCSGIVLSSCRINTNR